MGISLRELQKRLLDRQGVFLSFNNTSACRSLFVRSLCGLSSSSSLIAQYPYPCFHPFPAHRYCPRYKKIPFSDTSGVDPSCYTERLPEESVAGQIANGVFVRKGEILTTVAGFDSFPCFEAASPVILVKAAMSGQIAFSFLYEHPNNTAVLREYITLYRDNERIVVHTDTPFIGSGKALRQ